MKLGLRSGSLSLALLLGIAGAGCGDDDGMVEVDAGTDAGRDGGGTDSGPPEDTGPVDTGVDAPPPVPQANVRVAHLSPDTGPVRLCIDLRVGDTRVGGLGPLPTDGVIPFRGVSPYLALDIAEGVTYRVKAFVVEGIGDTVDCTTDGDLELDVPSADLEEDAYYMGAAIGFTTEQSVCGPNFMMPCGDDQAARIALFEDDGVTDAASAKVRVVHAVPNLFPVEVCYDPDTAAGEMAPVSLFASVAYGSASDYFESEAAITTGSFRLFPAAAAAPPCTAIPDVRPELPEVLIPTSFEAIRDRFNMLSPGSGANIATTFELDTIRTVFAIGIGPQPASMNPNGVLIMPWRDIPGAPAP
jgi:hypothetical protein